MSPEPPTDTSERLTLSPRAGVVVALCVVVIAVVVAVIGSGAGGAGGTTTVAGTTLTDSSSATPGGSVGDSAGAAAGGTGSSPGGRVSVAPSASAVVVHVVGAVERGGLVRLDGATPRVADALERAGGAAPDADLARVNLARPVVDGERLYVPRIGETAVPEALGPDIGGPSDTAPVTGSGAESSSAGVVDLNDADSAALETLPGIGPALAGRIIAWREEHGGFAAVEDLLDVSGIGDTRFADLEPLVTV